MGGTLLNALTVAIGTLTGLFIGQRLTDNMQDSITTGLGLVTLFVGMSNAGQTGNIIIPLLSIVIGVIIGEILDLEGKLEILAGWLQTRVAGQGSDQSERKRFISGFITASLVFCVGPLTFVGAIQDGMGLPIGFQQLAIKSVLDMFAGMAFAATLGIGVVFSILTVLILQGGLALLGRLLGQVMTQPMMNEMTAVGGLLLIGLALMLLKIKQPRIANFLPALVIAPLLVLLGSLLGINIYPL